MFTGIISGVGHVAESSPQGNDAAHGRRLQIQAPAGYLDDVQPGDSIALNGACMTITTFDRATARFAVDISAESLRVTTGWLPQAPVNLEKALAAHERMGGHLVAGHVDALGQVLAIDPAGESRRFQVRSPRSIAKFLAVKGSITVNGVSLTVNTVDDSEQGCDFVINLIPHTLQQTMLGTLRAGDEVHLEIDLIARYVERMLQPGAQA
jgi:riboflavin synthase